MEEAITRMAFSEKQGIQDGDDSENLESNAGKILLGH